MTSVPSFIKQIPSDSRNFVAVSSLFYPGGVNALNSNGSLSQATWANNPIPGTWGNNGGVSLGNVGQSSLNVGGKLRDMGKTYVSSGRTFRKVQAIVPNTQAQSTFGVGGQVAANPNQEYYTGYIELGWEGAGTPAPVARAP